MFNTGDMIDGETGKTYRVQLKTDLTDSVWTDLSGDVTAVGSTASKDDDTASGALRRFYRVLLVP